MKIALFDPSDSFRSIFKATIDELSPDIEWHEFSGINDEGKQKLQQEYDAIVTAKELYDKDFSHLIKIIRTSDFNQETPIFLFPSDTSNDFFDQAFNLGVTDIYSKQELMTVSQIFHRMISFANSVCGAKVLIIEDDIAVSSYYSSVFSELGLVVYQASCCEGAEVYLKEHDIELTITDINLDNGGQGQRIIRDIRHRRDNSEQGMPIMVMSSSSAPQYKTCLFYLGIDEYVVKPVLPREICLRAIHLIQKYRVERKAIKQADHFKNIAHYDNLTSAFSRHGFLDLARFCVANCKREGGNIGILYLDLDNFKPVNDKLGHAVGDEVLVGIVELLKNLLREQDMVCRWGGDEFVVLLQDYDNGHLQLIADRIEDTLTENKVLLHGVGSSIGLAEACPNSFDDFLDIIEQADQAMYSSKKQKKAMVAKYSSNKDNLTNHISGGL